MDLEVLALLCLACFTAGLLLGVIVARPHYYGH
jgi:hypothetical protein